MTNNACDKTAAKAATAAVVSIVTPKKTVLVARCRPKCTHFTHGNMSRGEVECQDKVWNTQISHALERRAEGLEDEGLVTAESHKRNHICILIVSYKK